MNEPLVQIMSLSDNTGIYMYRASQAQINGLRLNLPYLNFSERNMGIIDQPLSIGVHERPNIATPLALQLCTLPYFTDSVFIYDANSPGRPLAFVDNRYIAQLSQEIQEILLNKAHLSMQDIETINRLQRLIRENQFPNATHPSGTPIRDDATSWKNPEFANDPSGSIITHSEKYGLNLKEDFQVRAIQIDPNSYIRKLTDSAMLILISDLLIVNQYPPPTILLPLLSHGNKDDYISYIYYFAKMPRNVLHQLSEQVRKLINEAIKIKSINPEVVMFITEFTEMARKAHGSTFKQTEFNHTQLLPLDGYEWIGAHTALSVVATSAAIIPSPSTSIKLQTIQELHPPISSSTTHVPSPADSVKLQLQHAIDDLGRAAKKTVTATTKTIAETIQTQGPVIAKAALEGTALYTATHRRFNPSITLIAQVSEVIRKVQEVTGRVHTIDFTADTQGTQAFLQEIFTQLFKDPIILNKINKKVGEFATIAHLGLSEKAKDQIKVTFKEGKMVVEAVLAVAANDIKLKIPLIPKEIIDDALKVEFSLTQTVDPNSRLGMNLSLRDFKFASNRKLQLASSFIAGPIQTELAKYLGDKQFILGVLNTLLKRTGTVVDDIGFHIKDGQLIISFQGHDTQGDNAALIALIENQ